MSTADVRPLIIERAMPRYDAVLRREVVVAADQVTTWRAVRNLDLLTVRSPLLDASMWLRVLPARLARRAVAPPPRLVIGEGVGLPGWLSLGESEGHEIVIGAVGKFWRPVIEWREVAAAEFVDFDEPGWGKIAANFAVQPHAAGTLLSYECRTRTTDVVSRRRFLRYWWLIRPFVAHIMGATLRTVKADAEEMR